MHHKYQKDVFEIIQQHEHYFIDIFQFLLSSCKHSSASLIYKFPQNFKSFILPFPE